MTTLRKTARVLYHFGTNPDSGHALYVQMDDKDSLAIDGLSFPMSRRIFDELGRPAEITLTIERGDRLNEPASAPRVESQYLTEDERDALHDWWDEESTVSVESSFPAIARIVGTRVVHAWNVGYRRGLADADLQHGAENPFAAEGRIDEKGCTPYCNRPCSAACEERLVDHDG